ncbi:uncharacterized protein [Haliaeetus albicilla]|uniref:uncharacterized protein n=1 Tax=Haliaeetus albicilla TaxID=8969 RepID=UPI0037E7C4A5
MRCRGACGLVPPRSLLRPGEETPLPRHARGVGRRSARKARNCSAGTAQVRSSVAAAPSAAAALWTTCGTANRRSRAGSGPSGAPSAAGACAVPGSSVAARRARVSAAAGERRDCRGHAVSAVVRSSPGMPLTAAASGLRGLSLPGLPLLAAWEHRGTGGALTGCGRELLKLERPQKGN